MVLNRKFGRPFGAPGFEEAAVVVLSVDEGDVEAPAVEDFRDFHHRVYVALRWDGHTDGMGLRLSLVSTDSIDSQNLTLPKPTSRTTLFLGKHICFHSSVCAWRCKWSLIIHPPLIGVQLKDVCF
ncbi:hypothetical protein CRG98_025356 [Punica granatum]|uniref:Uncharacterized protein n=1 Tax=Punica granatum TaxID=22663 RepID=A0A2I0JDC2_PUNGR|nr:hypothetical protein CRG98_025356 [Punica granatum]